MKRPQQHVTDTESQLLLRQALPAEWVVRQIQPDYGIDYDVEIVEGGSLTGLTFCVQLKGSQSPRYSGASLCLPFEVANLSYFSEKVTRPVIIIVADLVNKSCVWLYSQRFVREVLRASTPRWYLQKNVTLYVPKANRLPETLKQLMQAVTEGSREEVIKQFGRPPLRLALQIEGKLGDPQAIKDAIKENYLESASITFDLVDAYLAAGNRADARRELEALFASTKTGDAPEAHVASAVRLVQELGIMDRSQAGRCLSIIDTALLRSDECTHKGIVFVARATKNLVILYSSFQGVIESGFFIDIAKQSKSGWEDLLKLQKSQHWRNFQAADNAVRSLVTEAIGANQIRAACTISADLAQAYSVIYPMIRLREGEDRSAPIATSAEQLLEYAMKLAVSIDDIDLRCFVLQIRAQLQFARRDNGYEATLNEMKDIAVKNKLGPFARAADVLLQHMKANGDLFSQPSSTGEPQHELSLEEEAARIRSAAEMTGVNLKDDNDPVAQTINLAIQDLNPERVLKFCQHLHVLYMTIGGIFAELYGLGSAGSKLVYCEEKNESVEGMQFDGILTVFKWRFCEGCDNNSPRPEDWRWTREWQRERQANMPEGLREYLKHASARYGQST